MCSNAGNTSNTYNDDLCSVVANFVAAGDVLAELELLLLLLLPLLHLSGTATLVENNDTNDTNVPLCIQGEGNLLENSLECLFSAVMRAFFTPRAHCYSFCFQGL